MFCIIFHISCFYGSHGENMGLILGEEKTLILHKHLHNEKFLKPKDMYHDLKLDILELLVCNKF